VIRHSSAFFCAASQSQSPNCPRAGIWPCGRINSHQIISSATVSDPIPSSIMIAKIFMLLMILLAVVNAAEIQERQVGSVINSLTSEAGSVFSGVTSTVGSVASEITSGAGQVFETVTSIGGSLATVITSEGGQAITLAASGAGVVTTFAGSVYTVATSAAGSIASSVTQSSSATGSYSFGFTSSVLMGLASVLASMLVGVAITL